MSLRRPLLGLLIGLLVAFTLVSALMPSLGHAQVSGAPVRRVISIGNHPRVDGLRINFRDRELDLVRGANLTIWSPYNDAGGAVRGFAIGLPLTGADRITGVGVGLLGVSANEELHGLMVGGLGAGAGGSVRGLAIGGAGLEDPGEAQSQGMRNIVTAMQKLGVPRVLGVAGGGILDSHNGGLRHDQPGFPAMFKPVSDRHMEAWHAMRDSETEWTMVATGDIVPGERTGVYRTRDEQLPEKSSRISVEDVADFMLKEMTARTHLRRRVGLGY